MRWTLAVTPTTLYPSSAHLCPYWGTTKDSNPRVKRARAATAWPKRAAQTARAALTVLPL